jgi:acetylornithine deacetylase/succinyl-diaminopimelate desuccinylase-like protein
VMRRLALAFLLIPLCAATPVRTPTPSLKEQVATWRAAHEGSIVRELADWLTLPNLAADRVQIERNAERAKTILEKRGIRVELLRVGEAPPVVFGDLPSPGARRTVIFYAHYDGQPVDRRQWAGDPWRPIIRDKPVELGGEEVTWNRVAPSGKLDPEWRLYGRSSSDDKAALVGWMAALDALRASNRKPAVHLKFFLEGEEEAGSPHLEALLDRYADRLRADLWLLCDGPEHQSRRRQIYFGARGVTQVEVTTYGATRRLHSGHYGNWAPNPVAALARILASLRDDEGSILVPHFSYEVRPLGPAERRALSEVPDVEEGLRKELRLGRVEGNGARLEEAIQRPAINFRGVHGGDVGAAATNSIPTEATASIDFRLVPDQTPEKVRETVEVHLKSQGYVIIHDSPSAETRGQEGRLARLVWGPGYPGYRTPMDLPAAKAVVAAVEEIAGGPVVKLPSLGGSIPMYLFARKLGAPVIGIPIANYDNNQHAANENLRLQNLWDGIETYSALFASLDRAWR